eukprot:jgi/Botrbrau1/20722/Bobra.0058s0051.1
MWQKVEDVTFDVMCGVPYTALPIATCMSLLHGAPMLMRRKEVKDYGTKKVIEGAFKEGQTCLIVEDLVTSGASVMETVEPLQDVGLKVRDVVVLIDREQGGAQRMASNGLSLHSAFKLSFILETVGEAAASWRRRCGKCAVLHCRQSDLWAGGCPFPPPLPPSPSRLPFEERAGLAQNPAGKRLFDLMVRKQTNLAIAADVPHCPANAETG